jgi:hypothetical protein
MSNRCSCWASTTGKVCRNKYSMLIANSRYCTLHANITFGKMAIHIQKWRRGKIMRRKLNNIFKCLPDDLQRKVIFYMREPDLIKKHHYDVISKIIHNKSISLIDFMKSWHTTWTPMRKLSTYIAICDLYKLHTKYIKITNTIDDHMLYRYSKTLLQGYYDVYLRGQFIPHDLTLAIELYNTLYACVTVYNKQYGFTYNINPSDLHYIYRQGWN